MAGLASGVARIAGDDIALVARSMLQGSLDSSPLAGKAVEVVGDIVSSNGYTMVAAGAADRYGAGLALMDMPQGLIDMVRAQGGRLSNVTLEGALAIRDPGTRSAQAGVQISRVVNPHIPTAAEATAAQAAQDAGRLDALFGSASRSVSRSASRGGPGDDIESLLRR